MSKDELFNDITVRLNARPTAVDLPRGLRSSNPHMLSEEFTRYEADHPRKPTGGNDG